MGGRRREKQREQVREVAVVQVRRDVEELDICEAHGERAGDVQSTALLPLPGVGLVAVGSRDANRFFPGMGTLFLRMMGESLATALKRFAH